MGANPPPIGQRKETEEASQEARAMAENEAVAAKAEENEELAAEAQEKEMGGVKLRLVETEASPSHALPAAVSGTANSSSREKTAGKSFAGLASSPNCRLKSLLAAKAARQKSNAGTAFDAGVGTGHLDGTAHSPAQAPNPGAPLLTNNGITFTSEQRAAMARLVEENLNKTIELLATSILPKLEARSARNEEASEAEMYKPDAVDEDDDLRSTDSSKILPSGDVTESLDSAENPSNVGHVAHPLEARTRTDDVRIEYSNPFRYMQLKDAVKKGLAKSGFLYPNFIQSAAIPLGTAGADLLIQSKSGTGKTIMFTTVVLHKYDAKLKAIQALIVTPTREIAHQINGVLREVGRCSPGYNPVCITGGNDIERDRKLLARATAVVGTPGRLNHMLRRNCIDLSHISTFVIDEADKMCLPNFMSDLSIIRSHMPEQKQTIACSATLPEELHEQLVSIMREPVFISSKDESPLLRGIKQFYLEVADGNSTSKVAAVDRIMESFMFGQCIVFAGSQIRAEDYFLEFQRHQWSAKLITGAQSHEERLRGLEDYHTHQANVFVSTDLLARGVDADGVRLVINMDVPEDATTYLHRMGRAGRFGSPGMTLTVLSSKDDHDKFRKIITELGVNRVLKYPQKYPNEHKLDIWDISDQNFQAEACAYGLFDDERLPVAPLASEEQLTPSDGKTGKVEIVYTHPRTETFKVDSEHEQQVTSNTIDDASSIAADSMSSFHDPHIDWYDEHRAEIAKMMTELIEEKSEESKSPVMFEWYFHDFQKTVLDQMTEEERSMRPGATIKKRHRRAKRKKAESSPESGSTLAMETEEPSHDASAKTGLLDSPAALQDETLKTGATDSHNKRALVEHNESSVRSDIRALHTATASKTSLTDCSAQHELPLSDDMPCTSASMSAIKHYPSLAYVEKGCTDVGVQGTIMRSEGLVVKPQFKQQKLTIARAVKIDIPPMLPENFPPNSATASENLVSLPNKPNTGAVYKHPEGLNDEALNAEINQALQLYWEDLYWKQLTLVHEGARKKMREQSQQQEGPGEGQQ